MENLHQKSELISEEGFRQYCQVFERVWSRETTFPDTKNEWSEENKAFGQCAPTALVIFDMYGGQIAYDRLNFHLWNIFPDGTHQDFSRSQFLEKKEFSVTTFKTKEQILNDESGIRTNMLERYELLKDLFAKEILEHLD